MIITTADLPAIRSSNPDKCIVLACGAFDIIHAGHIDYLAFAKSHGDILVVATPDDKSITHAKGPARPVNHSKDRMTVLDALRVVD